MFTEADNHTADIGCVLFCMIVGVYCFCSVYATLMLDQQFDWQGAGVGALKAFACSKCTGDILLEVDHDDLLTEDAISEVRNAFLDHEVGFVYSNFANFRNDFEPTERYAINSGWQYKPFQYKQYELEEVVALWTRAS